MNYLKEITKDLYQYLKNGEMLGETVSWFDSSVFPSDYLNGMSFKFVTKWEDINSLPSNIIPVLFILRPDDYHRGDVMVNDTLTSLKTLLVTDDSVKKFSYFVTLSEGNTTGNSSQGMMEILIDVDYDTDVDTYGYISREISTILKMLYYKARAGDYHYLDRSGKKLFFVPNVIERYSNRDSILGRIRHRINVRSCNFR